MHGPAMPSYISKRSGQNLLSLFFEDISDEKSAFFCFLSNPELTSHATVERKTHMERMNGFDFTR